MAKNYGNSGNNSLQDLIAYYQQLQPNLNAQDVMAGYDEFYNPNYQNNPFVRSSVSDTQMAPRKIVGENIARERGQTVPNIDTNDPEYADRLKAMQWMMMSESLKNGGYVPQEPNTLRNSFPFGVLANLLNPVDSNAARLQALTKLAREK